MAIGPRSYMQAIHGWGS